MPNNFYNNTGSPATGSSLSSATMRSEFANIAAGFDKLPTTTGNANKLVVVDAGGSALTAGPDISAIADLTTAQTLTNKVISVDSNTVSGIAASSFVVSDASGNLDGAAAQKVIPAGVVVGTTDTQTLTNKTLTTPVLSGTASGTTAGRLGYASGVLSYGDGTTQNEIGFRDVQQNSRSAAYTLVISDRNKHIFHPSADTTARIWTIPANSSVAFPIGTAVTFVNQNAAGAITIAITTDTMRLAGAGTTGSRNLAANGIATALKVTSTEWIISGTGLT